MDTESASSAERSGSSYGSSTSGSGNQFPTYASRWTRADLSTSIEIRVTKYRLQRRGEDATITLFDATAVLIAMVTLSQLPVGPSVGAAAVVLILGTNGVAATAAAGVLLTATGVAGALCFATWAALDRFHPRVPRIPAPEPVAPEPAR